MILVTGAGGLVGGALVERLRSDGFEVWAPARTSATGNAFDLNNATGARLPEGLQAAFLCAWHGGVAEAADDPEGTYRSNVGGNLALAARLRAAGTNMVFLSTSLVFSGADTSPAAPLVPCCAYGEQKAAVEAGLDSRRDAIVRLTKVGETLLPRLSRWADILRSGGRVAAAGHLRVAPVMLAEVVEGLVGLARDFEPGIFQMSAGRDHSYLDLAESLAARAGGEVAGDPRAGTGLFRSFPVSGRLGIAAPARARHWPPGDDHAQRLVQSVLS